ncbi:MAG: cation transporter [Candidatus Marinimicrobia bacterium]|jgi:cation diffusion facilitator family transporter|nr:cation transporter [Candidatus Neomarinimicrobiota bacterium]MBT4360779.1 cation transporter [Candidatus Neomarinimicrobiota bacterium]MBT4714940.1 cation transporter [Candidatus Neomarinimicrobiota bacterium]MBT4944683.1 cation transporter [Candidatus Neomarinimicrobiota bacterium]MBT5268170.1 cation transporter [Candidatus Neomarinimicrobiota bacterium]
MGFTNFLIRTTTPKGIEPGTTAYRGHVGMLEGWVSIIGNFVLFVIKLIFGWMVSSIALIADAFHTLSDVATSIVVIFGFRVAQKPADKEHPFGHGRAETIATLTIAILMAVVSLEFFKGAVDRLFFSEADIDVSKINWLVIGVVSLTAVGKAWMAYFAYQLGDLIDSDALRGDAVHHKSDVYTTLLVIAALVGAYFGVPYVDGIMGVGVAIMILHAAYEIAREAIDDLLGKPATAEFIQEITALTLTVPGARQVHDVVVHNYGDQSFISLHVEIDEATTPSISHNIADNVEHKLAHELNAQIVTHIDPVAVAGKDVNKVREIIEKAISIFNEQFTVQDLRIVGENPVESILFELPVPADCEKKSEIEASIREALGLAFERAAVIIEFKAQMTE